MALPDIHIYLSILCFQSRLMHRLLSSVQSSVLRMYEQQGALIHSFCTTRLTTLTLRAFVPGCCSTTRHVLIVSGGQDAPLLAPVRITMRASASSASGEDSIIPTCSYYNEGAGSWNTAGLATESMTVSSPSSSGGGQGGGVDVNLTCLSFHLSEFTVSTEEIEAAFRPVSLVSESVAGPRMVVAARERQGRLGRSTAATRKKHPCCRNSGVRNERVVLATYGYPTLCIHPNETRRVWWFVSREFTAVCRFSRATLKLGKTAPPKH